MTFVNGVTLPGEELFGEGLGEIHPKPRAPTASNQPPRGPGHFPE